MQFVTKMFAATFCAVVAVVAVSSQSFAQAKTVKACTDEWRANKDANQANGVLLKDYVAQCRAGGAPAPTVTTPPQAPAPAPTATAPRQAPAPAPTAAAPAPRAPAPAPLPTAAGVNQFPTEAQAKARCPADTVVWANIPSRIYHFAGTHNYGNTKSGAYMCEGDTVAAGYRAPKNEKHP
jgi:hypothetical protein